MKNKEKGKIFPYLPMDLARGIFWLMRPFFRFKRVDVHGKPWKTIPKGCGIIVANHTGFIDPFVLGSLFASRRLFILTAKEVMATPTREYLLTKAGCIKIDRSISDMAAVRNCVSVLKAGKLLGMFPEGHIQRDGEMDQIKSGAALIALQAGAPIIPLYSVNPRSRWHRHKVVLGEPLYPHELCSRKIPSVADMNEISRILSLKIEECKTTYEQLYG